MELKKRDNDARCPLCGKKMTVGVRSNRCPAGHYEAKFSPWSTHEGHDGELVSEHYTLGSFVVTIEHSAYGSTGQIEEVVPSSV